MGRAAGGVWGISLRQGDAVVALAVVVPDATLLVAGENGIGKRTPFERIPASQSRGGKGIITMKTDDKTGGVVGALTVRDTDEIMLITVEGQMVRTRSPESAKPAATRRASNSSTCAKAKRSPASPRSSATKTTKAAIYRATPALIRI